MSLAATDFLASATRTAFNAAHALSPGTIEIAGKTVNAVLLTPWERSNDFQDGRNDVAETATVGILKEDIGRKPKPSDRFSMNGRAGRVESVTDSGGTYELAVIATR